MRSSVIVDGTYSEEEFTDEDGHAEFEIEDEYDSLDDDTEIWIRVEALGEHYDEGPYTLGGGAFTVYIDPDSDEADEESDD